jgi:hypothetical protein
MLLGSYIIIHKVIANYYYFFIINVDIRASLRASRLISRIMKLTTI